MQSDFLYFKSLQKSSSVSSGVVTSVTGIRRQLLIAKNEALQVLEWRNTHSDTMSEQNGGTADWLEVVFEFQVHEKVEALKVLPCHNREHCEAEALDCLSSEASERILLVTSDFAAHVLTWDQNRKQFRTIACTVLSAKPHGDSPSDLPRHNGCTVSDPVIVEQSAGGALRSVLAGAFYNGILHIIGYPARFPIGGVEELDCVAVPFSQLAETPMGVRTTEQLLNVISMAFLPLPGGTNEEGRPLLAVLYESQGYLEQAVHLHCVAVDEPGGQLLPGPWVLRNVHPTTSLLRTFRSADPSVPSGVLAVSSRSCQLFTEASAGPVMSVEMEGIPTAMVELRPGSWIIGDSTGALWEVQPGGVPPARVSAAAAGRGEGGGSGSDGAGDPRLSAAETLLCLPIEDGTPGSGAGCIVFLGSHTGPSQVLRPAMSGSDPWQLLEPALEEGLSPINDAVLFEHPPGTGEQHLAVCGGSGHTGRFAIASLAAERSVLAEAGGCLPGAPRVFSVEAASGIGGPPGALLVLSSDSPESTAAMSFEDGCLAPCALPGLDEDSATLLVCSTDAGWIVQVTPREAAVLGRASGRRSSWSPPASRLTQACARGGRLLLASGSALHDLLVDEDSGKLLHVQSAELSRQISALAQLSLRSPGGQSLRAAAVGCWQDDCVSLLQAGELGGGPVASAALPQGQARSLLGRELTPGKTHLIAGTSCGLVAVYTVEAGQGDSIRLQLSCSVWAGNTPVDLVPLSLPGSRKPATREAAYALSSQDLLLRGGADGRVAALRVVGEGQAVSLARRAAGCGPLWPDARLGGPRRAPPPRAARRQPAPPVALVLDRQHARVLGVPQGEPVLCPRLRGRRRQRRRVAPPRAQGSARTGRPGPAPAQPQAAVGSLGGAAMHLVGSGEGAGVPGGRFGRQGVLAGAQLHREGGRLRRDCRRRSAQRLRHYAGGGGGGRLEPLGRRPARHAPDAVCVPVHGRGAAPAAAGGPPRGARAAAGR
uniref:Uncharacterized protein n=1 Tax=Tetraselmis sp. GSL018 TaxID=582737 RepID=A0A061RCW9_9CHLO